MTQDSSSSSYVWLLIFSKSDLSIVFIHAPYPYLVKMCVSNTDLLCAHVGNQCAQDNPDTNGQIIHLMKILWIRIYLKMREYQMVIFLFNYSNNIFFELFFPTLAWGLDCRGKEEDGWASESRSSISSWGEGLDDHGVGRGHQKQDGNPSGAANSMGLRAGTNTGKIFFMYNGI